MAVRDNCRWYNPLSDQEQTRLALAGLFVALARTLGEQDESFPSRFDANLERVYREMEDGQVDQLPAMEAIRWAHDLMRETS